MGKIKSQAAKIAAAAVAAAVRAEFEENRLEVLERVSNPMKKILFEAVYIRSRDMTDDLFSSNRGWYYELFAGIILGEIQTLADVKAANIRDTLAHEDGPDVTSGSGIAFQIKSPKSEIKVPPELISLREGKPTKITLKRVLEDYYKKGNQGHGYRYGVFWSVSYFDTILDIGHKTFENYAINGGAGFSFEQKEPKRPSKPIRKSLEQRNIITDKQVLAYLKRGRKIIAGGGNDFDVLKMLSRGQKKKDPLEVIDKMILDLEKGGWVLRFNPGPTFAKTMVNKYGVVVRTSIQQYENHDPFYKILGTLGTDRNTYLSGNSYTKGNKSRDYFYDGIYENFEY